MTAPDLHIAVDRLGKRYPRQRGSDIVALDGVSFSARAGERVGLIGRNGSGKSTLLQLISGVASPSAGTVDVRGRVSAVLTLGMGLREELTGRENVAVDAAIQNLPRARWDAVADAVLEFAELGEFGDRPVKTYSTGMKARLAFSMLVTIEPEILLIDEALSVGDARFSQKATERMRELCTRGGLVIIVSHGLGALRTLCDRCIWLDGGRIRADGPAAEVLDAYAEAVRREDERESAAQFSRGAGERSFVRGWRLLPPRIVQSDSVSDGLLGARPAAMTIDLESPPRQSAEITLEVVRMDGLKIFAWTHPVPPAEQAGTRTITLRSNRLGLGPGTYRATCAIGRAGERCAEATSIFKVEPPAGLSGGLPVLDLAWQVRAGNALAVAR